MCVCGDGCGGWGWGMTVLFLCDNSLSAVIVMVSFPPLTTVGLNSVLLISYHIHKIVSPKDFNNITVTSGG